MINLGPLFKPPQAQNALRRTIPSVTHSGACLNEPVNTRICDHGRTSQVQEMKLQGTTRGRILVVDDNQLVADTTVMVLLSFGFDAIAAYDPDQGLEIAKRRSFDLLVTDVEMSRMSGIELAIQVRDCGYIPKILLMSGAMSATADFLQNIHGRGRDFEILPKPTTASELIEKVHKMVP